MTVFGLAGMAEGAIAAGQLLALLGVVLAGTAAAGGLVLRWRTAVRVGVVVWVATTVLLAPYQGLWPPEPSDDPDVWSFQEGEVTLTRWWLVASGLLVAAAVRAWWLPPLPPLPLPSPATRAIGLGVLVALLVVLVGTLASPNQRDRRSKPVDVEVVRPELGGEADRVP